VARAEVLTENAGLKGEGSWTLLAQLDSDSTRRPLSVLLSSGSSQANSGILKSTGTNKMTQANCSNSVKKVEREAKQSR